MSFKNRTSKPLLLSQKVFLVTVGVILAVILLEAGLRLGGFVITSLQAYRNRITVGKRGSYRILCLGESTTQNQYPRFLEEILNERAAGITFSVIDKGVIGTTTPVIIAQLESYLEAYKPDMVIAMMGINDIGEYISFEQAAGINTMRFFRSSRIYKLGRLLWLHARAKAKEKGICAAKVESGKGEKQAWIGGDNNNAVDNGMFYMALDTKKRGGDTRETDMLDGALPKVADVEHKRHDGILQTEEDFRRVIARNPDDETGYIGLGGLYRAQREFELAEETYKRGLDINPHSVECYLGLGWLYRSQGKTILAAEAFGHALALRPDLAEAHLGLGWLYWDQGMLVEAEDSFNRVISLKQAPLDGAAYVGLAKIYYDLRKYAQAEEAVLQSLAIYPRNEYAYGTLGSIYQGRKKYSQAEEALLQRLSINPRSVVAYMQLGWLYRAQGKPVQAEEALAHSLSLAHSSSINATRDPTRERAYRILGRIFREQDKSEQAEELFRQAIRRDPTVDTGYGALWSLLDEKGDHGAAQKYRRIANKIRTERGRAITVNSYRRLKEITDAWGGKLVCVQYPLRAIEPLMLIFQGQDENIIFVDNEALFEKAVRKSSYGEYFRDMFAGDFGHCTDKGNRLLAENIADAILREVFGH